MWATPITTANCACSSHSAWQEVARIKETEDNKIIKYPVSQKILMMYYTTCVLQAPQNYASNKL